MATITKHFVLLDAYGDLTEKETFCLGEENMAGVLSIQAKKAKISDELLRLDRESPLDAKAKKEFDSIVRALLAKEAANDRTIKELMARNREAFKDLSKQGRSVNKFRRAYGVGGDEKSSSLKGKA